MALSKSSRIIILLVIDSIFFLLELIVGSATHSLALIADSFHMLNDVFSLCVGLWAVRAANRRTYHKMYTYGWQRAETLGALVNGVFLLALCLSIFLDAIQRFFDPQLVSNPILVFGVGTFGLVFNIVGLFLFHEHGHSHGHNHSHGKQHEQLANAEEGHVHGSDSLTVDHPGPGAQQGENPIDGISRNEDTAGQKIEAPRSFNKSDEDGSTVAPVSSRKRRHTSLSKTMFPSPEDISVHPASFRNVIIAQSKLDNTESVTDSDSEGEEAISEASTPTEETGLLSRHRSGSTKNRVASASHTPKSEPNEHGEPSHKTHKHAQPKKAVKTSGDLNIRGVFLHVLGDALGNAGVMISAAVIRFWKSPYAVHADPVVSLVITCIILWSTIPLVKAASRILLQAVPAGMDVDDIKEDIEKLPGILSCHHLHVWQLSNTKLVASLHVEVDYDVQGEGSTRYMELAQAVQKCLHEYGIHSSTIQPEFCLDRERGHNFKGGPEDNGEGSNRASNSAQGPKITSARGSKPSSTRGEPETCLLQCGKECDESGQCCAPGLEHFEAHDESS